ncbi:MAG: quinolinate phosphoribosyl transferase [Candidatus Dormibacteraeota bacterium]|nr:quinolinate phosphoribosyl transferase [Candidatus Dormibacteraeota bacterium]
MATEAVTHAPTRKRERLDPSVFRLPVERIREGYYSDVYFNRTVEVLNADNQHPHVLMQVFQKNQAVVGGMDEAIAIVKLCSEDFSQLRVHALYDGDEAAPWETTMTIEGDYSLFARLETVYLGVLSRRTKVATNVRRVVEAANGKQIMFFPARHDHHLVQTGDGYAAHVSGAIGVSTDAQASWWGGRGIGTVPHGLIAAYNGDTVLAARKYAEYMEPTANLVVLVDWENDCVRTSLEVARALKDQLWGVRLDTSETMVDVSVQKLMGDFDPRGVNPQLCHLVRRALDREGFEQIKIVASGGFNVDKIQRFEREQVPVDAYGVGSAFFQGTYDFTADVVMVEGRPCAKAGRRYRPNPRLEPVT